MCREDISAPPIGINKNTGAYWGAAGNTAWNRPGGRSAFKYKYQHVLKQETDLPALGFLSEPWGWRICEREVGSLLWTFWPSGPHGGLSRNKKISNMAIKNRAMGRSQRSTKCNEAPNAANHRTQCSTERSEAPKKLTFARSAKPRGLSYIYFYKKIVVSVRESVRCNGKFNKLIIASPPRR